MLGGAVKLITRMYKSVVTSEQLFPNHVYIHWYCHITSTDWVRRIHWGKLKMWVIILFIHHFSKNLWTKLHFLFIFIDNEKGIPHFKFAPLDYGYSGVYRQKCKSTGNPTSFIALCFCLKVGMSKNDWNWPWPLTFVTDFQNSIIKLNFVMTHVHKMPYD